MEYEDPLLDHSERVGPPGRRRESFPPFLALKPSQVSKHEIEGKIRIAEVSYDKSPMLCGTVPEILFKPTAIE